MDDISGRQGVPLELEVALSGRDVLLGLLEEGSGVVALNSRQAGNSILVSFNLEDYWGLNILVPGYPVAQQMMCSTGVLNAMIQAQSHNNSGLTYDAKTGRYTYMWQSDREWAGTCWQLNVRLNDGTSHVANFQFK